MARRNPAVAQFPREATAASDGLLCCMKVTDPNRRAALAILGASATIGLGAMPAAAQTPPADRFGTALVLSGGGARGAYEAGVIEGLVRAAGVRDGEKLPGVDIVLGTSIGAINGWFVATARYSALQHAWRNISAANLFRLKPRFAALARPSSGVATRLMESLALLSSLNTHVEGMLDSRPIVEWLRANIDPAQPTVVPLVFNAADIRNVRAAYFYVTGDQVDREAEKAVVASISRVSGMTPLAQRAGKLLHDALYASLALPLLFDPIELVVDGIRGTYVDGGSSDNSAVDVARVLARRVNVVLVEPVSTTFKPTNAVEAGLGSFNLLQQRALDASLRSAYFETTGKRLFENVAVTAAQRAYLASVFDADLGILRSGTDLAADIGDFDDAQKLQTSYDLGLRDAAKGWAPYAPPPAA